MIMGLITCPCGRGKHSTASAAGFILKNESNALTQGGHESVGATSAPHGRKGIQMTDRIWNTAENIDEYLDKLLQSTWWCLALGGAEPRILDSRYLERDGRKRKKIIGFLTRAGFIYEHESLPGVFVVSVAGLLSRVKPNPLDLVEIYEKTNSSCVEGVADFELSLGQKAAILKDMDSYYLRGKDNRGQACTDFSRVRTVVVSNDALDAHISEKKFFEEVENLFYRNLAWGLEEICDLTVDAGLAVVGEREPSQARFPGSPKLAVLTPNNDWAKELKAAEEAAELRIKDAKKALDSIHQIQDSISDLGGWDKFKTSFRAKIIEFLKEG